MISLSTRASTLASVEVAAVAVSQPGLGLQLFTIRPMLMPRPYNEHRSHSNEGGGEGATKERRNNNSNECGARTSLRTSNVRNLWRFWMMRFPAPLTNHPGHEFPSLYNICQLDKKYWHFVLQRIFKGNLKISEIFKTVKFN